MSNRNKAELVNLGLKLTHEAMIACLTDEGLSDEAKVRRYAELAGFDDGDGAVGLLREGYSPAKIVWWYGDYEKSLFADLPGCRCPVVEVHDGRAKYPGIPPAIPSDWRPDRTTLEAFARVQQEHRG